MPVFLYVPGTVLSYTLWGVGRGIATLALCACDIVLEMPLQKVVVISLLHTLAIWGQTFPSEPSMLRSRRNPREAFFVPIMQMGRLSQVYLNHLPRTNL